MNRTSLVLALIAPALVLACGAGENTVGTDWPPDAGNPSDTGTPKSPTLLMSAADTCFSTPPRTQSESKMFVVENRGLIASGTLTATLSGPAASSFVMTSDTCTGNPLAVGSGCAVYVAYAPDAPRMAPQSATLTVSDGASSASSPLQGGGEVPTVSPAALDFGTLAPGSTSNELLIQVTTPSLCGTGIVGTLNGPYFFISSNTCTDVNAGHCQIGVRFAPPAGSPQMSTLGSLTITSDSGSATVALSGAIKLANPQTKHLSALPSTLDFGEVMVGQSANTTFTACSPFTVGTPTVTVSGPGGMQFVVEGASRILTGPDATCTTFQIEFAPTAAGPSNATVTVTDGTETVTVSLVGKGLAAPVEPFAATPVTLSFGAVPVTTTSTPIVVTVSTPSARTFKLTLSDSVASEMVITKDTCTGSLIPANSTCSITLVYKPTKVGTVEGSLDISDGQSTVTVALTGQSEAASVGPFAATPTALDFGGLPVGVTSAPLVVTVSTPSARTFKLTLSDSVASEMVITKDTCTGSLIPAGGTCSISLAYKPTKDGSVEGWLNISDGTDVVSVHVAGKTQL